jgi:hypothetical protein
MSIFVLDIVYFPWRAGEAARISNPDRWNGLRGSRCGASFWLIERMKWAAEPLSSPSLSLRRVNGSLRRAKALSGPKSLWRVVGWCKLSSWPVVYDPAACPELGDVELGKNFDAFRHRVD